MQSRGRFVLALLVVLALYVLSNTRVAPDVVVPQNTALTSEVLARRACC